MKTMSSVVFEKEDVTCRVSHFETGPLPKQIRWFQKLDPGIESTARLTVGATKTAHNLEDAVPCMTTTVVV
ncbi:MAG TPA: hypothetical protein VI685_08305, partial [Candidatus Angelobacter sp.]